MCYAEFERLRSAPHISRVKYERHINGKMGHCYSRPCEEFCADFLILAKRILGRRELELFRLWWLIGADWRVCSLRLGMKKGETFHAIYRIEARLGRAFAETRPYALYPVDEYMAGRTDSRAEPVTLAAAEHRMGRLAFPRVPILRRAA